MGTSINEGTSKEKVYHLFADKEKTQPLGCFVGAMLNFGRVFVVKGELPEEKAKPLFYEAYGPQYAGHQLISADEEQSVFSVKLLGENTSATPARQSVSTATELESVSWKDEELQVALETRGSDYFVKFLKPLAAADEKQLTNMVTSILNKLVRLKRRGRSEETATQAGPVATALMEAVTRGLLLEVLPDTKRADGSSFLISPTR